MTTWAPAAIAAPASSPGRRGRATEQDGPSERGQRGRAARPPPPAGGAPGSGTSDTESQPRPPPRPPRLPGRFDHRYAWLPAASGLEHLQAGDVTGRQAGQPAPARGRAPISRGPGWPGPSGVSAAALSSCAFRLAGWTRTWRSPPPSRRGARAGRSPGKYRWLFWFPAGFPGRRLAARPAARRPRTMGSSWVHRQDRRARTRPARAASTSSSRARLVSGGQQHCVQGAGGHRRKVNRADQGDSRRGCCSDRLAAVRPGGGPGSTPTSATRRRRASPRSRSAGPRCATPSGPRRSSSCRTRSPWRGTTRGRRHHPHRGGRQAFCSGGDQEIRGDDGYIGDDPRRASGG